MYRTIRFLAFIALLLATVTSGASATWTQVATLSVQVTSAAFVDPYNGIIGMSKGPNFIMVTHDAGVTWTNATTPTATVTDKITDIWMKSATEGFATLSDVTGSCIWHTLDGGATWTGLPMTGSFNCVRETSHALDVTSWAGNGVYVSKDGGATFPNSFGNNGLNGMDFVDDLHGVAACTGTGEYMLTYDGGQTWWSTTLFGNYEAYGVYGQKGTPNFFAVPEISPIGSAPSVTLASTDYGFSWSVSNPLPFCSTGDIEGAGSILFVQNSGVFGGGPAGIYRSVDAGVSWLSIGGPNNTKDTRFAVVGCGQVIYAFDAAGGVWRTLDGGDGRYNGVACNEYMDSIKALATTLCTLERHKQWLHNIYDLPFDLISIQFADTSAYAELIGAARIDSIPLFPKHMLNGDSTAFLIRWNPGLLFQSSDSESFRIRVVYYIDTLNQYDTVYYSFTAYAISSTKPFLLSANTVRLDTTSTCATHDSLLTITNSGCGDLTLTQAFLSQMDAWRVYDADGFPLQLPITVASGQHITLTLRFAPHFTQRFRDTLQLTFNYENRDSSAQVNLSGVGRSRPQFQIPTRVRLDSVFLCSSYDSSFSIVNQGCDTLWLTAAYLAKNVNWNLFDSTHHTLVTPIPLLAGETYQFILHFAPSSTGRFTDSLTLGFSYQGIDSSRGYALTGYGRTGNVVSPLAQLELKPISQCANADSSFSVHNTTCDTIWLTSAASDRVGWTIVDSLGVALHYPIAIAPGAVLHFVIHFIPQNLGLNTANLSLHFLYLNNDVVRIVGLTGNVIPTGELQATAALDFGTVSTCLFLDSSVALHNAGCDSILIDSLTLINGSSGFSLFGGLTVPFWLHAGETRSIGVRFQPLKGNLAQDSVRLKYLLNNQLTYKTISLAGVGSAAPLQYAILPTSDSINGGSLSFCGTGDSTHVSVHNVGCDTSWITQYGFVNASNVITTATSRTLPAAIPPDSTLHFTILYTPADTGHFTNILHLQIRGKNGTTRDTSIIFTIDVSGKISTLAIDTSAINLGTTNSCGSLDTEIVFQAHGCGTVTISNEQVAGTGFTVSATHALPITLKDGQSDTIHVHFSPNGSGTSSASVLLSTNISGRLVISVPITATQTAPQSASFSLQGPAIAHASDQTPVTFALVSNTAVSGQGLHSISGTILFIDDLLRITQFTSPLANTTFAIQSNYVSNRVRHLDFTISSVYELNFPIGAHIVDFTGVTVLSDTLYTEFRIDSLRLNGGDSSYARCTLSLTSAGHDSLSVDTSCTDALVYRYMNNHLVLGNNVLSPDPVGASNGYTLNVSFTSELAGHGQMEIYDERGISVERVPIDVRTGLNKFALRLSMLKSAAYHYSIALDGGLSNMVRGAFVLVK